MAGLFDQLIMQWMQQAQPSGILGNLGQTMSDETPYPVISGQQYAGNASTRQGPILAVENLRRALGVQPTMTGVKATDDILKLIEEALQLAPGTKPK